MNREITKNDEPLDRLFKLLPAESTGAFMLLRGIFPVYKENDTNLDQISTAYYSLTALIIILTPILLIKVWKVAHWPSVAFLTGTLIVWIANIDIDRFVDIGIWMEGWGPLVFNQYMAKGLLIVWAVMLVPMVIPPKKEEA